MKVLGYTLKLSHWSDQPITQIITVEQTSKSDLKPKGFWISVDGPDDWPEWCINENYTNLKSKIHYSIILFQQAKILLLSNSQDIDKFTHWYGTKGNSYKSSIQEWRCKEK